MFGYILKRLGLAVLVALAVSIIAFLLLRLSGDPAIAHRRRRRAQSEDIELIRKTYGFDRPLPVQYVDMARQNALAAISATRSTSRPGGAADPRQAADDAAARRCCRSCFALAISIPLGVAGGGLPQQLDRPAVPRHSPCVGQALPNFFFALLLIMLFSITLRWLPVSGSDTWLHFVMPTIALGYYVAPAFMRLIRAGMIEVLEADYIRTARAKGLPARRSSSSTRCATQSCRWSRWPPCSSASCSAARWSSRPSSRSTGSATSPTRASPSRTSR